KIYQLSYDVRAERLAAPESCHVAAPLGLRWAAPARLRHATFLPSRACTYGYRVSRWVVFRTDFARRSSAVDCRASRCPGGGSDVTLRGSHFCCAAAVRSDCPRSWQESSSACAGCWCRAAPCVVCPVGVPPRGC